jgi:type IV secretory pathway TraG/TraD family ATPase VirD4
MANAGVIQSFRSNDLTTADWISRRSGQTTVNSDSVNVGSTRSPTGVQSSDSVNTNQVGRARLLPYEVMGLADGTGLYWLGGLSESVRFFAPYYWHISECSGHLPNPYAPKSAATT